MGIEHAGAVPALASAFSRPSGIGRAEGQKIDLGMFPNVKRWYKPLQPRAALRRGYDAGKDPGKLMLEWDEETERNLLPGYRPDEKSAGPARSAAPKTPSGGSA